MQLTGIATTITGTTANAQDPMLVRLARGDVQQQVCVALGKQLVSLHLDGSLCVAAAVTALFGTAADLIDRFHQYMLYPSALWRLSRRYNPTGYLVAAFDFLAARREVLDEGMGYQLQRIARRAGSDADAVAFLAADDVQAAVDAFVDTATATTLDVERRHAQARRQESSKLRHIASESRNALLRRFRLQRQKASSRQRDANTAVRKAMRTNVWSLACSELPSAMPLGFRAKDEVLAADVDGERVAARARVACHQQRFKDEVDLMRDRAKRARDDANVAPMPVTLGEWVHEFSKRDDRLRELMRIATAKRRKLTARLHAASGVPEPARRLQPVARARATQPWHKLLKRRAGWFLLGTRPPRLIFARHNAGRLFVIDARRFIDDDQSFHFSSTFDMREHLVLADDYDVKGEVEVWEAFFIGTAT